VNSRTTSIIVLAALASALVFQLTTFAQASDAIVIRAKRIYTVTKGVLENGEILIRDGKIQAIGPKVDAPATATSYSAEVVIPGMIDAHSHMALDRISSGLSGPITSEWKAKDHFDPKSPMIPVALSGGVTSIITRSGSGIISSGQSVAIKLKSDPGKNMILKPFVDLKMAVRPLIRNRPDQTPATQMGWYAAASEQFRRAREYVQAAEDFRAGRRPAAPPLDERLEAFAAVLRGEVMLHVHSHLPGELMMILHLAREFGFQDRLAFSHAQDAYPIASVLAQTKTITVVGPMFIDRLFGDTSAHNVVKELMDAGALASVQTDQSGEQAKSFREYGSFLIRHGLKEQQALEALTINGARAMMLADRIGSLEAGKDADLVLMDGPPFDLFAERIEKVFVDGAIEYERKAPRQTATLAAVGPFKPMRGALRPDDRSFVLTNANLFTVSHGQIANGVLVVRDGKIAEVRAGGAVPANLPVLDLGGRIVLPGFVSPRAGPNDFNGDMNAQNENNENIEPIVPEMNARFAIEPWYPSFPAIREVGITSQNIAPMQLNLIGGSGVFIKNAGMDVAQMVRRDPASMVFSVTRESAREWGNDSRIPTTPEAAAKMIAGVLDDARRYAAARPSAPYNQRLEALLPVLDGRVPAIIQAYDVEEIRLALKLAADYKLRLVVGGGVEAYKLAAELASAGASVILGNSGSNIGEYETIRGGGRGYNELSAILLTRAGVKVSFFSASGARRCMPTGRLGGEPALNAAWVFRNGGSEEEALKMVSLNAAEMLGVADQVGSLDVGKDADFMVLEGHPLDYRTLPQMVFVDGRQVVNKIETRPSVRESSSVPR
jgi:imidazolonepropionase-like amidohydrolase